MYKRLLSVLLAIVFFSLPVFAGNYGGGGVTADIKDALDGANSPSSSNVFATMTDLDAADTTNITLEYKLYRSALGEAYTGYIDCQLVISDRSDFDTPIVDVDTGTAQTSWLAYGAAADSYEAWSSDGMPATDIRNIIFNGASLTRGVFYYYRWRTYKHGDTGTATDYKAGMLCQ